MVYNAIDLEKFNPNRYIDSEAAAAKENDSTKKIKIANVGRFSKQKNQEFLIDVFYHLLNKRHDVELHMVGFGAMETILKQKVAEYSLEGSVYFYPPNTNIPKLFSSMDYFILPSLWEGFGIVVVEAQSMGLPCIVSDAVSQEVNCGLCYYLPLINNATEWANTIDEIIDSDIKTKVSKELIERFDIQHVVKEYEEIYS
jgi:glycosyltransferase involved in cell wall biosynthesis